MTDETNNAAYEVTWLIRRLFRAMGQKADEYLADSGLTAADRAVLEFLFRESRLSVPEIATRYQVSRQHVQVTVNRLLQSGLVETENNPRHKRSPLLRLSELGRAGFEEIRRREAKQIDALFTNVDDDALANTRDTLRKLYQNI